MANFQAVLMHGSRGGEGTYRFEGPDTLLKKSPVKAARVFMEYLEATHPALGHIDYEINAALKNKDKQVVTILGNLVFHGDDEQPFMCMISVAPD